VTQLFEHGTEPTDFWGRKDQGPVYPLAVEQYIRGLDPDGWPVRISD